MPRRYADPPHGSTTSAPPTPPQERDAQLSAHIFSVSAGMVGVCLTVIGLFRILVRSQHVDTIADDLLAADAVVFLTACCLAYLALRAHGAARARLGRAADVVFLSGLTAMVGIGLLLAYELI